MRLRDLFVRNVKTKGMALLMALGVWIYAYNVSLRAIQAVPIPLRISTPPNWTPVGDVPKTVTVNLSFPAYSEDRVRQALRSPGDLTCDLNADLEQTTDNEMSREFLITRDNFNVPAGAEVQVTLLSSPRLSLHFAREISREVPVEVDLSEPPPQYRIVRVWKWPQRVQVSGAQNVVSRLKTIKTLPVRINDVDVPPDMKITGSEVIDDLVPVDDKEAKVRCGERIEYTVYLEREPLTRAFENVPIGLYVPAGCPYKVELGSKHELKVEVTGPENVVRNIQLKDILLFIDVRYLRPEVGVDAQGRPVSVYEQVHWKILGVDPGEKISVKGVQEEVPVQVSAPATGG